MIRNFFNKYNFLMFLCLGLFYCTMCKPNHQITSDFFAQHSDQFASYVLKMKSRVEWGKWIGGESGLIKMAKYKEGCDDNAITCMQISYGFLNCEQKDIKASCRTINYDVVNTILKEYYKKPGDMNDLARISYVEHINRIKLPDDIDKDHLKKCPQEYKEIIAQKKVNLAELNELVKAGMCARYLVEKVFT